MIEVGVVVVVVLVVVQIREQRLLAQLIFNVVEAAILEIGVKPMRLWAQSDISSTGGQIEDIRVVFVLPGGREGHGNLRNCRKRKQKKQRDAALTYDHLRPLRTRLADSEAQDCITGYIAPRKRG